MNSCKLLLLSTLVFLSSCKGNTNKQIKVIDIAGLKALITESDHELHIINFWATWCNPCIKELPQFVDLAKKHPEINVSLVSLDYVQNLESKVVPFLKKNDIKLRVLLMDELDYNLWIDLVDPSWSGAIPATLIIDPLTDRRIFLEKEFENGELETEYQNFIKFDTL